MKFKQFDMAVKKYSDRLAEVLRAAGIRFEQRLVRKPEGRLVFAITVHPLDLSRADNLRAEAAQTVIRRLLAEGSAISSLAGDYFLDTLK